MSEDLKKLTKQFDEVTELCFQQLKSTEDSLSGVRLSLQKLYMLQDSLNKVRNGKSATGRFTKMVKGLIVLFVLAPAALCAGEYWVLTDTNLAKSLGPAVTLRSCVEPQIYVIVTTNWVPGRTTDGPNGIRQIHESLVIFTNTTYHFTPVIAGPVVAGPVVTERVREMPQPLPDRPNTSIR